MENSLSTLNKIDSIVLTNEEKNLLTGQGSKVAEALNAAKKKGEALKTELQKIVTEHLKEAGLIDAIDFVASKENPFEIVADSEVFKALRNKIVSSNSLYGCTQKELTKSQVATQKQLLRAFNSLPWTQPEEAKLSEAQKEALLVALAEVAYMNEISLELLMKFRYSKEEAEEQLALQSLEDEVEEAE